MASYTNDGSFASAFQPPHSKLENPGKQQLDFGHRSLADVDTEPIKRCQN